MKKTREQNEQECLDFCLSLSDDPKWKEDIKKISHIQRVNILLDNGFEFEDEHRLMSQIARELGAKGGKATLKKYGREHFSRIGRKK